MKQQNKVFIDPILLHSIKVNEIFQKFIGPEVYQEQTTIEKRSINFFYYFDPIHLNIVNSSKHKQN
ncbi:MAG: hypothetical protein ACK5B9_12895 [Flavobacteriia bacterium]|jgi:hypothetical protein